jgi:hypothetical protein
MDTNHSGDTVIPDDKPVARISAHRIIRALSSFVVGFVAGTAPFVLIYCLPALLAPGAVTTDFPVTQLLLLGFVVGMTTAIIFTEQVTKKWQDVFVYALGVPALLIATVGDISGRMDTNALRESMTGLVNTPEIPTAKLEGAWDVIEVKPSDETGNGPLGFLRWVFGSDAVAAPQDSTGSQAAPQDTHYLVTIGTYTNREKAIRDYRKFEERQFKTQEYYSKSLDLIKIGDKYLITYYRGPDRTLATKVYKLLKINDPGVPVQLFER